MNPENGRQINVRFGKSVIHSRASLSYGEAQTKIDDKKDKSDMTKSLRILLGVSKILKEKRRQNGALTLASTQVKFAFDQETHDPTDVTFYSLQDTNFMIEEFMLLANISVATKILEHFPSCSVLRRHTSPKANMIKDFSKLLES